MYHSFLFSTLLNLRNQIGISQRVHNKEILTTVVLDPVT
jgi:hypothetical protein